MNIVMQVDNQISRAKSSFLYSREISKPWGEIDIILAWCKTALTAAWRWQLIDASSYTRPGSYIFYFDSDQDCCAFTLKWQ